jgi:hypothetical protein
MRKLFFAAATLASTFLFAQTASTPVQAGLLTGSWTIVMDGHEGTLTISSVSATGDVSFNLLVPTLGINPSGPNDFRRGFWDESSQTISLLFVPVSAMCVLPPVVTNVSFGDSFLFEGYQFQTPAVAAPGQDVVWALVGHFTVIGTAPGGLTPSARRNKYGWRATIPQQL